MENYRGFLRVPGGVQQMEFRPNFAKGALLGVVSSLIYFYLVYGKFLIYFL